jgi:DivIVA domain-containing protein
VTAGVQSRPTTLDKRGQPFILASVDDEPTGDGTEVETVEETVAKTELKPARGRTFLPEVSGIDFSSSRRGYDRAEVDQYVERVSRIVVELEAMRSPDAVIERALADVGEETSAILRRARKAAEEIIADAEEHARGRLASAEQQARELREQADRYAAGVKSDGDQTLAAARAKSDETLSDARAQAQQIGEQAAAEAKRKRADADRYHAEVTAHIEQLALDRHRLIEDLRKLADQFHRTADRAVEQIPSRDGDGHGEPVEEIAATPAHSRA